MTDITAQVMQNVIAYRGELMLGKRSKLENVANTRKI